MSQLHNPVLLDVYGYYIHVPMDIIQLKEQINDEILTKDFVDTENLDVGDTATITNLNVVNEIEAPAADLNIDDIYCNNLYAANSVEGTNGVFERVDVSKVGEAKLQIHADSNDDARLCEVTKNGEILAMDRISAVDNAHVMDTYSTSGASVNHIFKTGGVLTNPITPGGPINITTNAQTKMIIGSNIDVTTNLNMTGNSLQNVDTMSGNGANDLRILSAIDMQSNDIINVGSFNADDVDTNTSSLGTASANALTMNGNIDMQSNDILNYSPSISSLSNDLDANTNNITDVGILYAGYVSAPNVVAVESVMPGQEGEEPQYMDNTQNAFIFSEGVLNAADGTFTVGFKPTSSVNIIGIHATAVPEPSTALPADAYVTGVAHQSEPFDPNSRTVISGRVATVDPSGFNYTAVTQANLYRVYVTVIGRRP